MNQGKINKFQYGVNSSFDYYQRKNQNPKNDTHNNLKQRNKNKNFGYFSGEKNMIVPNKRNPVVKHHHEGIRSFEKFFHNQFVQSGHHNSQVSKNTKSKGGHNSRSQISNNPLMSRIDDRSLSKQKIRNKRKEKFMEMNVSSSQFKSRMINDTFNSTLNQIVHNIDGRLELSIIKENSNQANKKVQIGKGSSKVVSQIPLIVPKQKYVSSIENLSMSKSRNNKNPLRTDISKSLKIKEMKSQLEDSAYQTYKKNYLQKKKPKIGKSRLEISDLVPPFEKVVLKDKRYRKTKNPRKNPKRIKDNYSFISKSRERRKKEKSRHRGHQGLLRDRNPDLDEREESMLIQNRSMLNDARNEDSFPDLKHSKTQNILDDLKTSQKTHSKIYNQNHKKPEQNKDILKPQAIDMEQKKLEVKDFSQIFFLLLEIIKVFLNNVLNYLKGKKSQILDKKSKPTQQTDKQNEVLLKLPLNISLKMPKKTYTQLKNALPFVFVFLLINYFRG